MTRKYVGGGCPPSVTDGRGAALSLFTLLLALAFSRLADLPTAGALLLSITAYACPIILYDLLVGRVHLRTSTGIDWSLRNRDTHRVTVKIIGMCVTFATLGAAYAAMPESAFNLFKLFAGTALLALPLILFLGALYIMLVDRVMIMPRDGFYEVGSLVLFRWRNRNWKLIKDFALGWTIKGFFLPIMFGGLASRLGQFGNPIGDGLVPIVLWLIGLVFTIDLVVGVCGYAFTLRPLDTHIHSANPLPSAWLACLACYPPFLWMGVAWMLDYHDGVEWHHWLGGTWLLVPWAGLVLLGYSFHLWTKLIFGLRFSNLTHRGIVTNGPYRFTKHPDYISKSALWWAVSMPFLSSEGWQIALLHSAMLIGVNFIYFLRAKTEERHLMRDPAYRAYAAWIAEHGIVTRVLRATFPGKTKIPSLHNTRAGTAPELTNQSEGQA